VLKQATSVSAKPTSGTKCIHPEADMSKPMKRPPNLEAVYLEGSSGPRLGVLPTTDLGVLAGNWQ
jgi:hypothetical protein